MLTELNTDTSRPALSSLEVSSLAPPQVSGASVPMEPSEAGVAAAPISWRRRAPVLATRMSGMARQGLLLSRRSRLLLGDPHVGTFDLLRSVARWQDVLSVVAVCGALAGIGYDLHRPLMHGALEALVEGGLGGMVAALIFFLAGASILFLMGRLLGGRGSWRAHAYLLALVCGPLAVLGAASGLLPVLGGAVSIAVSCYGFGLAVLATASAQRLSLARAVVAVVAGLVLISIGLLLVFLCVLLVAIKTSPLR